MNSPKLDAWLCVTTETLLSAVIAEYTGNITSSCFINAPSSFVRLRAVSEDGRQRRQLGDGEDRPHLFGLVADDAQELSLAPLVQHHEEDSREDAGLLLLGPRLE